MRPVEPLGLSEPPEERIPVDLGRVEGVEGGGGSEGGGECEAFCPGKRRVRYLLPFCRGTNNTHG